MKNKFFFAWTAFHGLILLSFLLSLLFSPAISFGTSLFDILPPSSSLREARDADSKFSARTSRSITILVKSSSFDKAKFYAEKLYSEYVDSDGNANPDFFETLSLYVASESVPEITKWLHENRFGLLDFETRRLLRSGEAVKIADDALSSVFAAFNFSDLSYLEEEPFLLSERSLKRIFESGALSATNMELRDGLLFYEEDGEFFVLIRGLVSEKGSSLTSKNSTVRTLYDIGKTFDDADLIFAGVPFHSYENSSKAQMQIALISSISLILIVGLFLLIFRSIIPALVSALAVAFSCAVGFAATLLLFRGIHALTFVFGTTLIGTCLDYSIHYFVNWKSNFSCSSGGAVRKHIFRGITLGFVSTEICFLSLFFAPFPFLRQVSVFLFAGLAGAYLSVLALYPFLKMPGEKSRRILTFSSQNKILPVLAKIVPVFLLGGSVFVILTNYRSLRIENNIQELYSMSPQMLQNEIETARILGTGSSPWYFLLKAASEEELLQINEELDFFLEDAKNAGKIKSYLSLAQFIPSEKRQRESYLDAENLLPIVEEQFLSLGFDSAEAAVQAAEYRKNYRSLDNCFVHPHDTDIPSVIKELSASLFLGKIEGSFYSCVLPLHAVAEEESFFRDFAVAHEGIFFVNKVGDISAQLDALSKSMLVTLAFAFVIVIAILFFLYEPRLVLRIAALPVCVMLVTTAVLILLKINLSFFPITALILVFGLGLDYIIYMIEGGREKSGDMRSLNAFAVMLSFATTAFSFGALALSSFPPVYMLGATVFAGLTSAVIMSFCMTKN